MAENINIAARHAKGEYSISVSPPNHQVAQVRYDTREDAVDLTLMLPSEAKMADRSLLRESPS